MKKSHLLLLIIACSAVRAVYADTNHNEPVGQFTQNPNYELVLRTLLENLRSVTSVPALSVSVIHKGEQVASVSSGYADIASSTKANENSIFRLASVSKVIGATMLAELVVEGRLDPDAPIKRYLENLDEKYHQITVRQLMAHTSGMPHYQVKDYDIYSHHYDSAISAVGTLKGRKLLSRPGSKYLYSTHGYTLAGAIYESISGKPLSQSLPGFLNRWGGRQSPIIEDIGNLSSDTASLYGFSSGHVQKEAFGEKSYSVFGAGLAASAVDLAYFGDAVLRKSRDNPLYQKLLFSPTYKTNGERVKTTRFDVGFGWRIGKDLQSRPVYHHAGATPGARSVLLLYPEQQLSIAILSNISWVVSIDKLASALASLYLDNAKPLSIKPATKYIAKYGTDTAEGTINCTVKRCVLQNENTQFTRWLNTFNETDKKIADWPIFSYATDKGRRLLMLNKVGITTLIPNQDHFEAHLGKGRTYSLKLAL